MKDGALRLTEKHILSVTALSMPEKHLWHGMQVTQEQNNYKWKDYEKFKRKQKYIPELDVLQENRD